MKRIPCIAAAALAFLAAVTSARAQENYTVIMSSAGPEICVGRWVEPRGQGLPGTCEGTVMGFSQFSALSARDSVDRLDQLLVVLDSIDRKMTANLDQVDELIDVSRATQKSIEEQVRQSGQILRETISRRFETLPQEILANDGFREELARLKEDILGEVDRVYQSEINRAKTNGER